jgi:Zn-dependent peptidase ImmA (M78 family)/transcriptional regulator with XRE-family HTH domain
MTSMQKPAELIRAARECARLSIDELAAWARLSPEQLQRIEQGDADPTWHEIDRCARVFGLRVEDLFAGEAGRAPMTLLLRSDADADGLLIRDVLTTDSDEMLGEFQRVVRDIAELERDLVHVRPTLPMIRPGPCPHDVHPGDHLARAVRLALDLGDDPIPSMLSLVRRLGVTVVWTDRGDAAIDGACTTVPVPAILVANAADAPAPWRVRTTLAHELCHLIFDLVEGRSVLVSPVSVRSPRLVEVERRARAFAACLLAPTDGVRRRVGQIDATSEAAIAIVGAAFGVGRTLAINRLQHIYTLTDDQRVTMESRYGSAMATSYEVDLAADTPPPDPGMRGGELLALAEQALNAGAPASRIRRVLGLGPTDTLPFPGLDPARIVAAISPGDRARRDAFAYLVEHHPGLAARDVDAAADGTWRVAITDQSGSRGHLVLGPDGRVLDDSVTPDPAR